MAAYFEPQGICEHCRNWRSFPDQTVPLCQTCTDRCKAVSYQLTAQGCTTPHPWIDEKIEIQQQIHEEFLKQEPPP